MGSQISIPLFVTRRSKSTSSDEDSAEDSYLQLEESKTLNSEVWKKLPEEILLRHVITKLPFNDLLRLCSVSSAWYFFICSINNTPNCRSSKSILIQSLTRLRVLDTHIDSGRWVNPPAPSSNLRVLASAGGLLCMSTDQFGELLIWNPITKSTRLLQLPLDSQYGNSFYHVFKAHAGVQNADRWVTKLINSGCLRVGLNYRPRTNNYQLIMAAVCKNLPGTTLIYDSRTKGWNNGPDVPPGIRFELNTISSQCGRYFYCAMHCGKPTNMLEFDFDEEVWNQFGMPTSLGIPQGFIDHRGKLLLLTRSCPGREMFLAFELRIYVRRNAPDLYIWREQTHGNIPEMLSKKVYGAMRTRDENLLMKLGDRYVQCHGRGNLLYFVGTSVEKCTGQALSDFGYTEDEDYYCVHPVCSRSLSLLRSFLRVWIHDTSTNRMLHLTEWEFEGYDDYNLISFQLFNPSLCSRP